MRKHPQIVIGVLLIALFICIAITAPLLAPNDPNATNLALKNAPPSAEYPLGCDQMGRCELSRLIYGARYSLSLTVPVLIVLAAIALFIGCYTSYKGGLIDEVIRLLCDIFMAFPLLVIAMSLVSVINNSVASIITAIGISMSAWFLRMARSYAKTECGKGYVESARVSGASAMRIVLHHIIPNVLPQFVVYFTTGIASAILSVSSFAFLGVGLIAGTPEWGAMLNDARNSIYTNPALIVYAESETMVQTALSALLKGRTVIVIAHRMRTIANADKIVVLDKGKVTEVGTPSELAKKGGLYAHLVALQQKQQMSSLPT